MHGLQDLAHSERGVWSLTILVVITVALFIDQITAPEWIELVKYLTTILVASKTVTTAIETRTLKEPQIPRATVNQVD